MSKLQKIEQKNLRPKEGKHLNTNVNVYLNRNLESAFRYTFNRIVIELERSQIL